MFERTQQAIEDGSLGASTVSFKRFLRRQVLLRDSQLLRIS
jgi:hypothetical protein